MIKEGNKAPPFQLDSAAGPIALADFAGTWLVVYFYPKDLTPGCTTEAIDFQKAGAKLTRHGAKVVGISRDPVKLHEKFAAKCDLGFPLLSDPEAKTIRAYDAWGEKNMYGKKVEGIIRSTVLISPDGKVARIWRPVRVPGHVDAVLETLAELAKSSSVS